MSVDLFVDDRGAGEPALLLVHGYTGSSLDWADSHDALAADRRVVAYDHRGHGRSGHAAEYSIDLLVEDLAGLVDRLGLERFDLLGHSMGGVVAMRYVLDRPERVRSLVLMDTFSEPTGDLSGMLASAAELARAQGMPALAELGRDLMRAGFQGDDARVDELWARVEEKYAGLDVEAFVAFGEELGRYPSMTARLGEIACPTTVLVGSEDFLRPAADTLAAGVGGAELVVFEGCGHSPQEDDPAAWQAAVLAHLSRA